MYLVLCNVISVLFSLFIEYNNVLFDLFCSHNNSKLKLIILLAFFSLHAFWGMIMILSSCSANYQIPLACLSGLNIIYFLFFPYINSLYQIKFKSFSNISCINSFLSSLLLLNQWVFISFQSLVRKPPNDSFVSS